jgi:hypothetical protein
MEALGAHGHRGRSIGQIARSYSLKLMEAVVIEIENFNPDVVVTIDAAGIQFRDLASASRSASKIGSAAKDRALRRRRACGRGVRSRAKKGSTFPRRHDLSVSAFRAAVFRQGIRFESRRSPQDTRWSEGDPIDTRTVSCFPRAIYGIIGEGEVSSWPCCSAAVSASSTSHGPKCIMRSDLETRRQKGAVFPASGRSLPDLAVPGISKPDEAPVHGR